MRILHVTPSYYPAIQFGGPIQSVHLLNTALQQAGVNVDVFTTNAGLEKEAAFQSSDWQELDGLKIRYFRYHGYVHFTFSPKLGWALLKAIKHYELVHITAVWNFPVWVAAVICKWHKKPYVISPRGTIYPETVALKSALIKRIYYWLFARFALKNASAIHFTAQDEQDKVGGYLKLPTPSFVIPNGINTKVVDQPSANARLSAHFSQLENKSYVLFLSRIHPKKGLDLLMEAFAKVTQSFPDLYLVIAGPDNEGYQAVVEEYVQKQGLADRVIFTGMLSGERKWAAYRDAALFVLPSYSENFGMSVVEAMACRTPVVISDQVGISADIQANEAGIVTKTNAGSVADGILLLLTDTDRRQKISTNARKMVQDYYSVDSLSTAFLTKYKELIRA